MSNRYEDIIKYLSNKDEVCIDIKNLFRKYNIEYEYYKFP